MRGDLEVEEEFPFYTEFYWIIYITWLYESRALEYTTRKKLGNVITRKNLSNYHRLHLRPAFSFGMSIHLGFQGFSGASLL
ncbi:hypothetical protein K1719_010233 [Acacia pycnantha]|nr:hypothetical protein K1719_010233 [Acacia pycnantha]